MASTLKSACIIIMSVLLSLSFSLADRVLLDHPNDHNMNAVQPQGVKNPNGEGFGFGYGSGSDGGTGVGVGYGIGRGGLFPGCGPKCTVPGITIPIPQIPQIPIPQIPQIPQVPQIPQIPVVPGVPGCVTGTCVPVDCHQGQGNCIPYRHPQDEVGTALAAGAGAGAGAGESKVMGLEHAEPIPPK